MRADHVLAKDLKAFACMEPVLRHYHPGKFVVFQEGRLQGSFDTFHNAASAAVRRFRDLTFVIRQVAEGPVVVGTDTSTPINLSALVR